MQLRVDVTRLPAVHAQIGFEYLHVLSMADILDFFSAFRLARDLVRFRPLIDNFHFIFSKLKSCACANRDQYLQYYFNGSISCTFLSALRLARDEQIPVSCRILVLD